jgi:hypothetical protein
MEGIHRGASSSRQTVACCYGSTARLCYANEIGRETREFVQNAGIVSEASETWEITVRKL